MPSSENAHRLYGSSLIISAALGKKNIVLDAYADKRSVSIRGDPHTILGQMPL